jgi:unspecific monooxygenase
VSKRSTATPITIAAGVISAGVIVIAAVALVLTSQDGEDFAPVVGVWPAAVERGFVEHSVQSGFLDRFTAQCVLESLQQEFSLEQFRRGLDDAAATAGFGDAYVRALKRCSLIRSREPGPQWCRLPRMAFFNPTRPSFLENPHPALARLRAEEPVYYDNAFEAWVVTSYDDCVAVLRDAETYSSVRAVASRADAEAVEEWHEAVWSGHPTLIDTDPPLHTQLRRYVNKAYTPATVERLRGYIDEAVSTLLASVPDGEPFDVMTTLAKPLPLIVKMEDFEMPAERRDEFTALAVTLMGAMDVTDSTEDSLKGAHEARQRLFDYFRDEAAAAEAQAAEAAPTAPKQEASQPDATPRQDGGDGLPDPAPEVLFSAMVDLIIGGNDDLTYGIGNTILELLRHPKQLEALRREPERLPKALEELLRYDGPSHGLIRYASTYATLGGREIAAGDAIFVLSGAANRDPSRFEEPDRLALDRDDTRHLGFGRGPHYCLGAPLARMEMAASIAGLLSRFSTIKLIEEETTYTGNFVLRGPERLTIVGSR